VAVGWLEPIKAKNPSISYGDLYSLAGVQAVETMGGPEVRALRSVAGAVDV
jgi:cytochrome c peroxidase